MAVEPATLDDLDRIVDLWVALAAEQRDHGSHLTAEPNREVMREALAQDVVDHRCLVARGEGGRPGSVVGFVSYDVVRGGLTSDVERGVVENLYVVPESRGAGIGSALIAAAERALEAAGVDRLALEVMAPNDGARRFYEARGYSPHRVTYERSTDGKNTKGGS